MLQAGEQGRIAVRLHGVEQIVAAIEPGTPQGTVQPLQVVLHTAEGIDITGRAKAGRQLADRHAGKMQHASLVAEVGPLPPGVVLGLFSACVNWLQPLR